MLKKTFPLILLTVSLGFITMQSSSKSKQVSAYKNAHKAKFSNGGPGGRTGAPGESNCTECHIGNTLDGTGINLISFTNFGSPVTRYVPNSSHNVKVQINDPSMAKGFQLVPLMITGLDVNGDPIYAQAGVVNGVSAGNTTANDGIVATPSQGRRYIDHLNTGLANDFATGWRFIWIAPVTNSGPVTFYMASNASNANGNSGPDDKIYLSQQVIVEQGVGLDDENGSTESQLTFGFSKNTNTINGRFETLSISDLSFVVTDINGKQIQSGRLGTSELGSNKLAIKLENEVPSGIYGVTLFQGNTPQTVKIFIGK